jgi:predicted RNA methylase
VKIEDLEVKDGFWVRPGTSDTTAVSDTKRMFSREGAVGVGDVVLDLGAHIGTFTGRALAAGAAQVRSVEPGPENIEMFKLNIQSPLVDLWEGAACVSETGE